MSRFAKARNKIASAGWESYLHETLFTHDHSIILVKENDLEEQR